MEIKHVEARCAVCVAVSATAFVVLVSARTKCFVADTRQHDYSHLGCGAAVSHGIEHLGVGLRSERVVDLRAVDRDLGDAVIEFKEYVAVLLDCLPFAFAHRCIYLLGC